VPELKPVRGIRLNKSHPLVRGLVGCWLFNEGSGNIVQDSSGNGNTGSLIADTHWVPGKSGPALDFDGTGDNVEIAHNDILNSVTNKITIVALVNVRSFTTNYQRIIAKSHEGTSYELGVRDTGAIHLHWV